MVRAVPLSGDCEARGANARGIEGVDITKVTGGRWIVDSAGQEYSIHFMRFGRYAPCAQAFGREEWGRGAAHPALKRVLRNQERRSAARANFPLFPGLTPGSNTTSPLRG